MNGVRRFVGLAVVAALLLGVPACIKVKYIITVYPDGSGKLVSETQIPMDPVEVALELMSGLAGDEEGEEVDMEVLVEKLLFDSLKERAKGLVAWSRIEREKTEEGETINRFTGYFDDINKLRFTQGEGESGFEHFSFARLEDGSYEFTALITMDESPFPMPDGPVTEEKKEEARQQMKAMGGAIAEGLEITYTVRMPGETLEAEGVEVEGRQGKFGLDLDTLVDRLIDSIGGEQEKGKVIPVGKVRSGAGGDLAEEMAAFREEMEKAKADWEVRRAALAKVKGLFDDEDEETGEEDEIDDEQETDEKD